MRLPVEGWTEVCGGCAERARELVSRAPDVPVEFWLVDQMRDALASWHMGRVIAAYRTHPHHSRPLSQEQVGGWVGLTQAQLSRIEHGPPIKDLDRLTLWARTLRIPTHLLWFKLRDQSAGVSGVGSSSPADDRLDDGATDGSAAVADDANRQPWQEPPRTLPPTIPDFTGRDEERATLAAALRRPDLPRWVLISGQAGLGKTALAIRVAHDVADLFPDGQLFVRLRRPDGAAVPPEAALASLLRTLGCRGAAVPQELDERSALFRSAIVDRRLLLVLDDAVDEAQLRWLLPGSPACAVLLTSRSRLAGVEGLDRPPLEPLSVDESRSMLCGIVGRERVGAEPDAARELIEIAAGLPLALRIVAGRLVSRPQWRLEHMRALLSDERQRLDWLKAGDHEVRASLMTSYAYLSPHQQRLFRLLGLLRAPDFPAWVASALTNDHSGRAERDLDSLADIHLVDVSADDIAGPRYRLHPLVRLLAAELASLDEPPEERERAIARVIGGYLVAADNAAKSLPPRFVLDALPTDCWSPPNAILDAAAHDPQDWFAVEQSALRAAIAQATVTLTGHSWRLLQRFALHLDHRHDLDTMERLTHIVLPAVKASGDHRGEAGLLGLLCHTLAYRSRLAEIPMPARRAVHLRHALRDTVAEIEVRKSLGTALALLDRPEARQELRIALKLARRFHQHYFTGRILVAFAYMQTTRRENRIAVQTYEQALNAFSAAGCGAATAARDLGVLLMLEGRLHEAEAVIRDAYDELNAAGDRWRAATVQVSLADVYVQLGRLNEAERLLRVGHAVLRAHHDVYGDGVALYIHSRLARARGEIDLSNEYAEQAAAAWARLPWTEHLGIEQWRGDRKPAAAQECC